MTIYYYLSFLFLALIYLYFSKKFEFKSIVNSHQKFATNNIPPLLGGYFLVLVILLNDEINLYQKVLFFLIFLLGTSSDFKIINSPNIRLILQTFVVIFFISFSNLNLENTRIEFLDFLLRNLYFNLLFCSFCVIILMNGSNFIDGLNGLASGYYIIVLFILSKIGLTYEIANENFLHLLIFVLVLTFILNLFNKIYLGDSGSYLIGFFIATLLISVYSKNSYLSPFYIILLIWYPCFENLFSLTRKFYSKISPFKPDNLHLHQLIFNKILIKTNLQKNYANNLTSILILAYNFFAILFATTNYSNTKLQIFILLLNIFTYLVIYFLLKKK
tara:strand:+ start:85 stop:1077 length:993 start_codon:yes stop_codon:yes gene_type:complete